MWFKPFNRKTSTNTFRADHIWNLNWLTCVMNNIAISEHCCSAALALWTWKTLQFCDAFCEIFPPRSFHVKWCLYACTQLLLVLKSIWDKYHYFFFLSCRAEKDVRTFDWFSNKIYFCKGKLLELFSNNFFNVEWYMSR